MGILCGSRKESSDGRRWWPMRHVGVTRYMLLWEPVIEVANEGGIVGLRL